jgi:hypothetical protein
VGLYPSLVALLFASVAGTLPQGARVVPATVGWIAVVPLALLGARNLSDPLALGRLRFLPWAAWLWVVFSWWTSPVPRAGTVGVLIAPFCLLAVSGVAWCWREEAARRLGSAALIAGSAVLAAFALIHWSAYGAPRPALPLGHHNLLGLWLLGGFGIACGELTEGSSRETLPSRRWRPALLVLAVALSAAALLATRSLAAFGGIGAAVVFLGLTATRRRHPAARASGSRWLPAVGVSILVVGALGLYGPRLVRVVAGEDASTTARWGYAAAAGRGLVERPLRGWGPGASSWQLTRFMRPSPGVHPPSEIVTDPHSLPLDLLFDSGLAGLLLIGATAAASVARRRVRGPERAWCCGLLAMAVASLGAGWFDVAALPMLVVVLVGGGIAASGLAAGTGDGSGQESGGTNRWTLTRWTTGTWLPVAMTFAGVVGLGWFLAPWMGAQRHYEASAVTTGKDQRVHLERAVAGDPTQPLYRFQLALLGEAGAEPHAEGAAEQAGGISAFWLVAGGLQGRNQDPRAAHSLARACDLDPLAAAAPYALASLAPEDPLASERLARALIAEPRLLAAPLSSAQPDLLRAAVRRVETQAGLSPGWRSALVEAWQRLATQTPTAPASGGDAPLRESATLELRVDAGDETSLSLYAFRRQRMPLAIWRVTLDRRLLEEMGELVAASRLVETESAVFAADCRLGR